MPTDQLSPAPPTVVEFRVAGYVPTEHAKTVVAHFVDEAMMAMGVASDDVRRIVIADNESYGPAIAEFAEKAGYTDDGVYRGIGKNIPNIVDGAYRGSNLVLHQCLIGSFAAQSGSNRPEGEIEAMRYGFYHEFGHCADHRRRATQHLAKTAPTTNSTALRCAYHNRETFLSEYAACVFSARFLPPAGYRYFARASRLNLETYLSALATKRSQYQLGLVALNAVRDAALDAFWRGLIEYGKMYAFLAGNPELDSVRDLPVWPARNGATASLLAKLAEDLCSAWKAYPDCEEDFGRLVSDAWFGLTAAEGFRFEVKPEGDYLWLT